MVIASAIRTSPSARRGPGSRAPQIDNREPYLASAQVRPCVHYHVGTAASPNARASDQQIALILRKDRAELADLCLMHLQIQIVDRRKKSAICRRRRFGAQPLCAPYVANRLPAPPGRRAADDSRPHWHGNKPAETAAWHPSHPCRSASIPSAVSHRTGGARARATGAPHRARLARPRAAPPGPGPADVRRGAQQARRAMPA